MAAAAETVIGIVSTAREQQKAAMASEKDSANLILASGTAVALLIGFLFAVLISRGISRPIRSMTGAMQRLAQGDLEAEVPAQGRGDEIGEMAGAVQIFKSNAQEKVRLEAEQAEKEKQAEAEKRKAMLALADSFEASVGRVVNEVSSASAEMTASSETMTSTAERAAKPVSGRRRCLRSGFGERPDRFGGGGRAVGVHRRDRTSGRSGFRCRQIGGHRGPGDQRPDQESGRGGRPYRRGGGVDHRHRRSDQPVGAQRDHRGGAGR